MSVGRDEAWTCLLANVLVLPGLGSILGGRKAAGALQVLLATVGFLMTTFWMGWFVLTWIREASFPLGLGPYGLLGVTGVAVFVAAWTWSLGSGLALLREAQRQG